MPGRCMQIYDGKLIAAHPASLNHPSPLTCCPLLPVTLALVAGRVEDCGIDCLGGSLAKR